jgi:hypothetical protein
LAGLISLVLAWVIDCRAAGDAELAHQPIGNSVIIVRPVRGSAITRWVSPSRMDWIPTSLAWSR